MSASLEPRQPTTAAAAAASKQLFEAAALRCVQSKSVPGEMRCSANQRQVMVVNNSLVSKWMADRASTHDDCRRNTYDTYNLTVRITSNTPETRNHFVYINTKIPQTSSLDTKQYISL